MSETEASSYLKGSNSNERSRSLSPNEDFDPLNDCTAAAKDSVFENESQDYDRGNNEIDGDEESEYSSIDYDRDQLFGSTPPNPRAVRRLKDKKHCSRTKLVQAQELIAHLDQQKKRSMLGTRSRNYDRNQKLSFADVDMITAGVGDGDELHSMTGNVKVDTHSRIMCLNSKPVVKTEDSTGVHLQTPGAAARTRVPSLPRFNCPDDRFEFYRNFAMLIRLGNMTKKETETRAAPTFTSSHYYGRQLSSEQQLWQMHLCDLIWFELQAYVNMRTNQDQDNFLVDARFRIDETLDRVMNFCTVPNDGVASSVTSIVQNGNASSCCCSHGTDGACLRIVTSRQFEVLSMTTSLLDEVEQAESLYPTQKALSLEHSTYATSAFQSRIATLCLWVTITRDIAHKLKLMAELMHINKDASTGTAWACIDFAVLNQLVLGSVPSDTEPPDSAGQLLESEDSEEEDDEESISEIREDRSNVRNGTPDGPSRRPLVQRRKSVRFEDDEQSDSGSPTHSDSAKVRTGFQSSRPSSTELTPTSVYRSYVDAALKKSGLRKLRLRLTELLDSTLQRARLALINVPDAGSGWMPKCLTLDGRTSAWSTAEQYENTSVLRTHGASSPQFSDMALPSFRSTYLFLLRIPIDVIHECLKLRLEQRPDNDPSLLSLRQLIHECKEVLNAAVNTKQYYLHMIESVVTFDADGFTLDMETYEDDLKKMLEVYFDYIQAWMSGLQQLPEMSKRLKNFLEEEWNFTKKVCPHVRGGEADASNRFCLMASSLLRSTSDFLVTGVDEILCELYNSTDGDTGDDDGAQDEGALVRKNNQAVMRRQVIIQACRDFKCHFHEMRERSSKALGFAKMLRKDLEVAAKFYVNVSSTELLSALQKSHHVRVVLQEHTDYAVFIPQSIADRRERILELLSVTCGRDDTVFIQDTEPPDKQDRQPGYLILMRADTLVDENGDGSGDSCRLWCGDELRIDLTVETAIAVSHIKVDGLLLVVTHSSQLYDQRKEFEQHIGNRIQLIDEQTSCHQAITLSLAELKNAALGLRSSVANAILQVDQNLNFADLAEMDEAEKTNMQKLYRETLHQCYSFGFEYHREVTRLLSGEARGKLCPALLQFARDWMRFVAEKCERGRGLRPRWANQGLDFLLVACEPRVLGTLSEQEFVDLKLAINNCVTHVIGDKATSVLQTPPARVSSPDLMQQRASLLRISSVQDQGLRQPLPRIATPSRPIKSAPSTPLQPSGSVLRKFGAGPSSSFSPVGTNETEDEFISFEAHSEVNLSASGRQSSTGSINVKTPVSDAGSPSDTTIMTNRERRESKMRKHILELEQRRVNELASRKLIGRPINCRIDLDYHVNLRRVTFKWQRGIKIGEGQFGKVYTAVNMDTGTYMAMKEIVVKDHQTLKTLADEIKICEGIVHPNLVQFYGVEIYRDEVIIFMEYCSHGTIEDAAKQGLTEDIIRRYTKDILRGIHVLHEHGIVHRDIKGANIFLTNSGNVKLGDFGCSIKLKSHTTMPGELRSNSKGVGTPAFMAPECITNPDAAGRAADIWSLGCVVIEMATGKRPFPEMENKVQIMFHVGMGGVPRIPENLSAEGQDFLQKCLQQNVENRWTASQLKDHLFVTVYNEEDTEA